MHKETSDELAMLAARALGKGDPLAEDARVDEIIAKIEAANTQEGKRNALRAELRDFISVAKSLAATAVSQADGPEDK